MGDFKLLLSMPFQVALLEQSKEPCLLWRIIFMAYTSHCDRNNDDDDDDNDDNDDDDGDEEVKGELMRLRAA